MSPDIIANMRDSDDKIVNFMFTNPLSNTGRLQILRNNSGSDHIQFSQSKSQQSVGKFFSYLFIFIKFTYYFQIIKI